MPSTFNFNKSIFDIEGIISLLSTRHFLINTKNMTIFNTIFHKLNSYLFFSFFYGALFSTYLLNNWGEAQSCNQMFSAWLDRWHFLLRYIFLDDDQKISKLLIRKLFFNSDHFMDSILASMSILVKILLYRSQPTNSIIPGLREINFLQHTTMAAIMTVFS